MNCRIFFYSAALVALCGCRSASEIATTERRELPGNDTANTIAAANPETQAQTAVSAMNDANAKTSNGQIQLAAFQQPADTATKITAPDPSRVTLVPGPPDDISKDDSEQDAGSDTSGDDMDEATDDDADDESDDAPDDDSDDEVKPQKQSELESLLPPEAADSDNELTLMAVVASVHQSFPLLEVANLSNDIADGKQLAALGAFDTKFKAASENGPTGFYQTYRNNMGVVRPLYDGGEVFGGFRIGRGDFQPWYLERQTNDGGEFKAGMRVPLARNREIDARRAELWRATYDQQITKPEIQAQLIMFVRDASYAFWKWVAAGHQYEVGRRALQLAETRNGQLKRRVEEGDEDPPVLQDNLRAIAKRESKLIDLKRKLDQAAIKLSLFSRSSDGTPFAPSIEQLIDFPVAQEVFADQLSAAVQTAIRQRPELVALDAMYRRANVDLAEAQNDFLPSIDAQLVASQDIGEPTSSKRDKSQFEVEAGLFVDVPFEQRKARGKSHAAHAKMHQISAKRRFTEDKIATEVRFAVAALQAAYERIERTREARRLAEYMADIERRKFDLGQSDLLKVVLREQYAVDAAVAEIDAQLEYFNAQANVSAALANAWPLNGGAIDER